MNSPKETEEGGALLTAPVTEGDIALTPKDTDIPKNENEESIIVDSDTEQSHCSSPISVDSDDRIKEESKTPLKSQFDIDKSSEDIEAKESKNPPRISGAARKRFKYLLKQGYSYEDARILAREPINAGSKEKGNKRQHPEDKTPEYIRPPKQVPTTFGRFGSDRGSSSRGGRTVEVINYQFHGSSSRSVSTRSEMPYRKVDPGIRMAVIHKMHPDITLLSSHSDLIQAKLEHLIDGLPVGGPSPQFSSTKFERGVFWLTCANETTKDWLVETIAGLESLWEGGSLTAVQEKDMPKRRKVLVWIPGSSVEEDAFRTRLMIQNPSINTHDWNPLGRKVVEKGETIAFSVDEASFNALKKLDFRPYWGLGRVTFSERSK